MPGGLKAKKEILDTSPAHCKLRIVHWPNQRGEIAQICVKEIQQAAEEKEVFGGLLKRNQ